MKLRRIFFWLLCSLSALFLILAGLVAGGFWLADPYQWRRLSSTELAARFHIQHAGFEKVVAMAEQDGLNGSFYENRNKVSFLRREEYDTLLRALGGPYLYSFADGPKVSFVYAQGALSAIGPEWIESIEYCPGKCLSSYQMVGNLDAYGKDHLGDFYAQPLGGGWYLAFESFDG